MDRLSVLIGDCVEDGSVYEESTWPFRVERIITTPREREPFNFAATMNRLWQIAKNEYVVLLNDDLVIRNADWLIALMTFAVSEDIGGVGARLLYPDDTIQHVGMPGGVFGPCTHAFVGRLASLRSYQNWAEVHREWSMVTGAVFAVRRDVLRKVLGFDQRFSLDFNDVDLCLRLRLLGYRIVYTPFAEMTHYEGASRRGRVSAAEEVALFLERWQDLLKDDPAYHPRLTRSSPDVMPMPSGNDWWVPGHNARAGTATWQAVRKFFARGSGKLTRLLKLDQATIR
jgi:GT2 family glycosyltransferase